MAKRKKVFRPLTALLFASAVVVAAASAAFAQVAVTAVAVADLGVVAMAGPEAAALAVILVAAWLWAALCRCLQRRPHGRIHTGRTCNGLSRRLARNGLGRRPSPRQERHLHRRRIRLLPVLLRLLSDLRLRARSHRSSLDRPALLLAGILVLLLMTLALAPYRITCAVQKTKHAADQAIRRLAHWRCYAAQHGTLPVYSALPRQSETARICHFSRWVIAIS